MTWGNPPKFSSTPPKQGKQIKPEQLAGDSEHSQQVALFAWAALSVGKYPALAYMFAIPNGGARSDQTRMMLAAEGVRSGVPDIFLPTQRCNGHGFVGLFIEMKIEKYRTHKNGGCSEAQLDFINHVTAAGYYCKVCYNWIEARDAIIAYLEGKL
jgi:hypothetical protein